MRRMFCPKCGKKNDEDAKYCAYCGGEIVDTQPEEVSPGQFLRNRLEVFFRGDARKGGAAAKSFLVRHRGFRFARPVQPRAERETLL